MTSTLPLKRCDGRLADGEPEAARRRPAPGRGFVPRRILDGMRGVAARSFLAGFASVRARPQRGEGQTRGSDQSHAAHGEKAPAWKTVCHCNHISYRMIDRFEYLLTPTDSTHLSGRLVAADTMWNLPVERSSRKGWERQGKRRMTRIGVSSAIAGRMVADAKTRGFRGRRRRSSVCAGRVLASHERRSCGMPEPPPRKSEGSRAPG